MTPDQLVGQGMQVALAFFALGVLVLFITLVLARIVGFVRDLLG